MTTDVVWQLHSLIEVVAASNFLSEFSINYETCIRILADIKQSSFSKSMKNCFE